MSQPVDIMELLRQAWNSTSSSSSSSSSSFSTPQPPSSVPPPNDDDDNNGGEYDPCAPTITLADMVTASQVLKKSETPAAPPTSVLPPLPLPPPPPPSHLPQKPPVSDGGKSKVLERVAGSTNACKHAILTNLNGPVVVDIGVGRGGDLGRYLENERVRRVYAVEPDTQNLREAQRRWAQFVRGPQAMARVRRGVPLEIIFIPCSGTDVDQILSKMAQRGDRVVSHLEIVLMNSFTFFCLTRTMFEKFVVALQKLRKTASTAAVHLLCMTCTPTLHQQWQAVEREFRGKVDSIPNMVVTPDSNAVCKYAVEITIPGSIVRANQREGAVDFQIVLPLFQAQQWNVAHYQHGIPLVPSYVANGGVDDVALQFLQLYDYVYLTHM